MAKNATESVEKEVIQELPPRIHFGEFAKLYTDLDEVQQAGFKAYCKKEWMRKEEWQECLDKYSN